MVNVYSTMGARPVLCLGSWRSQGLWFVAASYSEGPVRVPSWNQDLEDHAIVSLGYADDATSSRPHSASAGFAYV